MEEQNSAKLELMFGLFDLGYGLILLLFYLFFFGGGQIFLFFLHISSSSVYVRLHTKN